MFKNKRLLAIAILALIILVATLGCVGKSDPADIALTGIITSIGHASIKNSSGVWVDYPAIDIKLGSRKLVGIVNSTDNLREDMEVIFVIKNKEMSERIEKGEEFDGKLIDIIWLPKESVI